MDPAAAAVIRAPAEQPTIQQAIAAAVDGDAVLVAPGTYLETLDFLGKAITVTSEAGRGHRDRRQPSGLGGHLRHR